MANFYYHFVPHLSLTMEPLFRATASAKKGDKIDWTLPMEKAFKATKLALCNATNLVHLDSSAPITLTTDASNVGVRAVLEQFVGKKWQPLAFFSKVFSTAKAKYSAFDWELLAVHAARRHFRFFLEGRQFQVFTNHKLLVAALFKSSEPLSAHQARHLAAIPEYTLDLCHVSSKANLVADALSRVNSVLQPSVPSGPGVKAEDTDLVEFPALFPPFWRGSQSRHSLAAHPAVCSAVLPATAADLPALAAPRQQMFPSKLFFVKHSDKVKLELVGLPDSDLKLVCEMSLTAPRPLVPKRLRRQIIADLHGLALPGVKASIALVKKRFFWPGLPTEVRRFVQACVPCQRAKTIATLAWR